MSPHNSDAASGQRTHLAEKYDLSADRMLKMDVANLYYSSTVTASEAGALRQFFLRNGGFSGDQKDLILQKENDRFQFRFQVKEGMENNPEILGILRQLAYSLSAEVFEGAGVDVHVCDGRFENLRIFQGHAGAAHGFPEDVQTVDPDVDEQLVLQDFQAEFQEAINQLYLKPSMPDDQSDTDAWVELREVGYVNCLFVAISRGVTPFATVYEQHPLPNLASLSEAPAKKEVQNWLERLDFPYQELNSAEVIRVMERIATTVAGTEKWYSGALIAEWGNLPASGVLFRMDRIQDPGRGPGVRVHKVGTVWPRVKK